MIRIKSIGYVNLDFLADRLNKDLREQRAVGFHNNGGIFVITSNQAPKISKFLMKGFNCSENEKERYGALPQQTFEFEHNFFKAGVLSDLFPADFLNPLNKSPSEPIITYGPIDAPLEIKKSRFIGSNLDSPDYGPRIGSLIAREVPGLFELKPIERVYWQR